MRLETLFLLLITVLISGGILSREIARGQLFSLLSFYSAIFLLETVGGALKAGYSESLQIGVALDEAAVLWTLTVALLAYLLFLAGYFLVPGRSSKRRRQIEDASKPDAFAGAWNHEFQFLLVIAILITTGAGFIQVVQRVTAAGGFEAFLSKAYMYRFGTFAETDQQNVLVVFANLVSGCTVGLIGMAVVGWLRGKLSEPQKAVLVILILLLLFRQWASMLRSTFIFTCFALVAVYNSERPMSFVKIGVFALFSAAILVTVNYVHQYLFEVTADWNSQTLLETIGNLVAPQGHFYMLSQILVRHGVSGETLGGQGLFESTFFFIPRILWTSKAPSTEFGTGLVQSWLDLPTGYQMATTNAGELIAHFGYSGILGVILYGALYKVFDSFRWRSLDLRVGLYCLLLPRVLVDLGMGISAVSITIVNLLMFLGLTRTLQLFSGMSRCKPSLLVPVSPNA